MCSAVKPTACPELMAEEACGDHAGTGAVAGGTTQSPLNLLARQSAPFGCWEVVIHAPQAEEREYDYQGKKRISYQFHCILVSTADPTQYMLGDNHGRGMTSQVLEMLKNKFKEGLVFQMSKVIFVDNVKQQYNSAPKTEVVSMRQTTWTSVLNQAGKPQMPEPNVPVADSVGIEREQMFDALGLARDMSEIMPGGRTLTGKDRVRCLCHVIDGSMTPGTDKVCALPVTIFSDAGKNGETLEMLKSLQDAVTNHYAMAFFGIQGKRSKGDDKDTWAFTSSFSFALTRASNTSKGQDLETRAQDLLGRDQEAVPQTQVRGSGADQNTSFADRESTETTCALFATINRRTNLRVVEEENTCWQINWCRVSLPAKDAQIHTNDGSRLWMQVKVEDETGSLTLFMREQAALNLAGVEDKNAFENARAQDALAFPAKASVKIYRKAGLLSTPTGAGKPGAEDDAGHERRDPQSYIVDAAEQAMEDTPSKGSLVLLNLLRATRVDTDACVPAALGMVTKSPHYGLKVRYVVDGTEGTRHCTNATVLVAATKASKMDKMNEGYMMTTEGIRDVIDGEFTCTLVSFCNLTSAPDYQLKPGRGQKEQLAVATICDVLEPGGNGKPTTFLVNALEKIQDVDAENAPHHMRRTLFFASMAAKQQGTGETAEWTEQFSPAIAAKCRRLGKSPTDEALDQFKSIQPNA